MNNSLAKQYTFSSLILFALPNIVMMLFLSLYTIVDGIFVSRFIGTTALSAINIILPLICVEMAVAIMLASGGSSVIARKLGEHKKKEARKDFSFIILVVVIIGILFALLGNLFIDQIISALGASQSQFELCRTYGGILLAFTPFFFLQTAFQIFFVTAGKPTLGLIATIGAGIANIVLDYFFIVVCHMGIAGAAIGTGIGYCIPSIFGLIFFAFFKKNTLRFTKPVVDLKMLLKVCTNGSSEMVTNLANAVTTFLFNYSFMKYYGEDGVAAITIVLYFQFIFTALYFGYSMGISPIISYKYGANDAAQLKKIFRTSIMFIAITSISSYLLSIIILQPALTIFTKATTNVFAITIDGFPIFAISFLLIGFNIFASAMFTALSDGKVSAIISFTRTFIFLIGALLILPLFFSVKGLWLSVPVAEALGIIVSIMFLITKRQKYNY
jgi:putative MATE family efflux protein